MSNDPLIQFYQEAAALTRRDLVKQKMLLPLETIQQLCNEHHRQHRDLKTALSAPDARPGKAAKKAVAAIQKEFPRSGISIQEFDHLELARKFESQCAAVAVVTEKNFYGGSPSMLTGITHLVKNPVIRWDFIVDEYQLMQSKLWGADAVRLITALLDQSELNNLIKLAQALDLEVIAEANSKSDLERLAGFDCLAGIYIENELIPPTEQEQLLAQIPAVIPVLINGDRYLNELDAQPCDGAIFFRGVLPGK